jgi:hypothetical protein
VVLHLASVTTIVPPTMFAVVDALSIWKGETSPKIDFNSFRTTGFEIILSQDISYNIIKDYFIKLSFKN